MGFVNGECDDVVMSVTWCSCSVRLLDMAHTKTGDYNDTGQVFVSLGGRFAGQSVSSCAMKFVQLA